MKASRQVTILEVIHNQEIETQEELADALREHGFQVTQATISRDIKELRLVKVLGKNGSYHYATAAKSDNGLSERLIRMFSETVLTISCAYNQIILADDLRQRQYRRRNHRPAAMAGGTGHHRGRQYHSFDCAHH